KPSPACTVTETSIVADPVPVSSSAYGASPGVGTSTRREALPAVPNGTATADATAPFTKVLLAALVLLSWPLASVSFSVTGAPAALPIANATKSAPEAATFETVRSY